MDFGVITLVAAICSGPATAQDWTSISGEQVTVALTDQVLIFGNTKQKYFASGRTLNSLSQESRGNWVVRGDRYCSQWPPSDQWDCYDMTRLGQKFQFMDRYGNVSKGRLAEE